ncbi:MAG: lipopolysaccharide assembly protein LapA domain-containing protein [Cyanobacteria bacterium]|nr:lipopolysaccharide assembly protein LapA domain-containing protein [Cyanobacteriota bacterium]MDW8200153.1 lipopolysaccharide assembly protein LapA domain-containing protein [Cyanobacteriota bacterium SKYGB_h_bin112]
MARILLAFIVAAWVSGIAILSVQNATLVSVQFLTLRSVQMPVGILLAFCVAIGAIVMAVLQVIWNFLTREE